MSLNKITITGSLGSGKSVVGKKIAEKLGCNYLSTGQIQRKIAARYNMTTLELNKYAETHREIDDEIDGQIIELKDSPDGYVIDSRMAWHFIPGSFKVNLTVALDIAAERVHNDKTRNDEKYADFENAKKLLRDRKSSENKRYSRLYGVDCSDYSNFDLNIDTSYISIDKVVEIILMCYESWKNQDTFSALWLAPVDILPVKIFQNFFDDKDALVTVCIDERKFILCAGYYSYMVALSSKQDIIPVCIEEDYQNQFEKIENLQQILQSWEKNLNIKYGDFG